jgi:hypothetical protein
MVELIIGVQPKEKKMEKAYDLKALGEKILEKMDLGLTEEQIERLGKAVYEGSKEWAIESAQLSENKLDDLFQGLYGFLDQFVLPQIEKLDLNKDGK